VFDLTLAEVIYHDEREKEMNATTQKMCKNTSQKLHNFCFNNMPGKLLL
jgi:hypothetical protein